MSMPTSIATLKEHFGRLIPGKRQAPVRSAKNLQTGFAEIDHGISQGITRKRITEWTGPLSSGKRRLLHSSINHWCASGLNVAYIDSEGNLSASHGVFIENPKGKLWFVRPQDEPSSNQNAAILPLVSKKNFYTQEAIWSADQFIRSNAFDVVVLDLGSDDLTKRRPQGIGYCSKTSRIYARLQRALNKSKTALIIVSDSDYDPNQTAQNSAQQVSKPEYHNNFGYCTRFVFECGKAIHCKNSLASLPTIVPATKFSTWHGSRKQEVELTLPISIQDHIFRHQQISYRKEFQM